MEAALRVFERDGFWGTDTNRIAREAGYSPASFYRYFADKLEVFLAVYDSWIERTWADVGEALAAEGEGERARRVTAAVLAHHRRWYRFRLQLRVLAETHESVRRHWLAERNRQLDDVRRALAARGRRPSRSRLALALLTIERAADAIASGEAEELGANIDTMTRVLETLIREALGTPR